MMTLRQKLTSYSGCLLLVLAVHAVVIILAMHWSAPQAIELPPAGMMVELAPLPTPAPPPPPNVVQPPQPAAPVEIPPLPKPAEAPKPEIAIPKPIIRPKAKPPQPKPQKKPEPQQEMPAEAKPVVTPLDAKLEKAAAAPQPSSMPSDTRARSDWQSDLQRHLAKYKRYPEDARRRGTHGTVNLRFVVDADGWVLSFSLVGNSGSSALDQTTLEMIRRAQPLPKPPAEALTNGALAILVPFVYSLDKR